MNTYLVLAGGRSTRLPNKLFLTARNGAPVFYSALYAIGQAVGAKHTVIAASSEDKLYMQNLIREKTPVGMGSYELWGALKYKGIIPTIQRAAAVALRNRSQQLVVLCGDNIYPRHWLCQLNDYAGLGAYAFTAKLPEDKSKELDGYHYSSARWVHRDYTKDEALLTPWVFDQRLLDTIRRGKFNSIISLLNQLGASMVLQENPAGWYDLGTPESWSLYKRGE